MAKAKRRWLVTEYFGRNVRRAGMRVYFGSKPPKRTQQGRWPANRKYHWHTHLGDSVLTGGPDCICWLLLSRKARRVLERTGGPVELPG